MKKILFISTFLALVLAFSTVWAFENEPVGFNGIPWKIDISKDKNMVPIVIDKNDKAYAKKFDSFNVKDVRLDTEFWGGVAIAYGAFKGRFYEGTVMFSGWDSYEILKAKFLKEHGKWTKEMPDKNRGITKLIWQGGKVTLSLTFNEKNKKGNILVNYLPILNEVINSWMNPTPPKPKHKI